MKKKNGKNSSTESKKLKVDVLCTPYQVDVLLHHAFEIINWVDSLVWMLD